MKPKFHHINLSTNNIKNVLLYTNLNNLIKNIDKRRSYDPRGLFVFEQFTKREDYTHFWNHFVKSFIRPSLIKNFGNVHTT